MGTCDEKYMLLALELAQKSAEMMEVPVGAVVVWEDDEGERIVGRGYNLRETAKDPIAHAEMMAIKEASDTLKGWRLHKATLYVTLEPCPMCAGAIINSRIKRVVFGAFDPKNGAFGSVVDLSKLPFNHNPIIDCGVKKEECAEVLSSFFRNLRKKNAK